MRVGHDDVIELKIFLIYIDANARWANIMQTFWFEPRTSNNVKMFLRVRNKLLFCFSFERVERGCVPPLGS